MPNGKLHNVIPDGEAQHSLYDEKPVTTDTQREAVEAVLKSPYGVLSDNTPKAFMDGYQAALATLPKVTEGELRKLLTPHFGCAECVHTSGNNARGAVIALTERLPHIVRSE